MTRDEAIAAADRCAATGWEAAGGPGAFAWHDALNFRPPILAQYVAANRGANAMQLYRFCVAGEAGAVSWTRLPLAQRVAVEVFRATFLALLFEVEEAAIRASLRAEGNASRVVATPAVPRVVPFNRGDHVSTDAPPLRPVQSGAVVAAPGRQIPEGAGALDLAAVPARAEAKHRASSRHVAPLAAAPPKTRAESDAMIDAAVARAEQQWAADDGRPKPRRVRAGQAKSQRK